jgi:hypothetical protein
VSPRSATLTRRIDRRAITEAVPGPAGKALTNAVFHAYRTGDPVSTSSAVIGDSLIPGPR